MISLDSLESRGHRRVVLATLGQVAAKFVGLILGVVVSIGLARGLGRTDFAWASIGLVIVGLGAIITDVGMTQAASRDIATHPQHAPRLAGALVITRLVLSIPLLALSAVLAVTWNAVVSPLAFVVLMFSLVLAAPTGLTSVFGAHLRPGLVGVVGLLQSIAWAAAVVVCWTLDLSLAWYAAGFTLATLLMSVATFVFARRLQPIVLRGWLHQGMSLLKWSWPICLAGLAFWAIQRLPLFVVQVQDGIAATALFAGSWRFFEAATLVLVAINSSFIPIVAAMLRDGRSPQRMVVNVLSLALAFGGGLLAVVGPVSERFGTFILTSEFAGIGAPLALTMVTFAVFAADSVWGGALIAAGRSRILAASGGVAAVLSGVMALMLVPEFGASGAALAVLVAELVRIVILGWAARSMTGRRAIARTAKIISAVVLTWLIGVVVRDHLALTYVLVVEALAYVSVILILGVVPRSDLRAVLQRRVS